MFSVPKLSSSLGLIGNDPKLAFRTQPSGIARLAERVPIAETDDVYWFQYVSLFDSASDVSTLIAPQDIRRALNESPVNVATLVRVVSRRLKNLLLDHTFPSPPSPVISLPKLKSWSSANPELADRNTTKELLNCLRVLGRILPVIFELQDDTFEEELFWKRQPPPTSTPDFTADAAEREEPQFVIEEDDNDDDAPATAKASTSTNRDDLPDGPATPNLLPCLADELFSYTIDLLFCCGFTIPASIQVDHHKINYLIWDKGIGSTTSIGSSSQFDTNKTEVLRFLLILLSKTIYHSPNHLLTRPNKWAAHIVQSDKTPRRLVLSILCSLLNTAMNNESGGISVSVANWGSVVDKVPYNHLIMARKGEEGRAGLVGLCLGVLCVLLEYQVNDTPPSEISRVAGLPTSSSATLQSNSFRYFLAKLHRTTDFDFILNGILSILETDLANTANFLPGSRKPIPYILETFVFFWKTIELNKKFRAHLLESDKLLDTIAYLLCYCLENKDKQQHHGLCRALSYILQSLSAEKSFGQQMQSAMPPRIPIPPKWAAPGTAADFFVSSIYSIVATTSGALNSLYPALIIALANVAPYMKNLTVKTSNRMVQLFCAFSNPIFLLADDGHPRLVFFMLEALNGILFHQLANNPNVIYAILRSHQHFEELGTFTLAKGLSEVRRVQQLKEEGDDARKRSDGTAKKPEKRILSQRAAGSEVFDADIESEAASLAAGMDRSSLRSPPPDSESQPPAAADANSPESAQKPTSEKARGKMRERMSLSDDAIALHLDPELERIAAAGVGRNGFVPTQEWVTSWQQGLPLDPILLMISELLPKVVNLQNSLSRPTSTAVFQFLGSVTLQHVLPPAPQVNARRFQWSEASLVWLSSLIWGEVYVHGTAYLGIWNGTNVRLFGVRHTPQPRGMGGAMQNVMGGLGWGSSPASSASQQPSASRITSSNSSGRPVP